MRRIMTAALVAGSLVLVQLATAEAQESRNIYANPTNLQVLPKDISVADLRNTMRAFSLGTGIRCASCHVGEEGQSMLDYDFAADTKERKAIARGMLKMVAAINAQVATIRAGAGYALTEVRCVTCHRGQSRPRLLSDTLDIAVARGGTEAAVAKYTELREQYYGSHTYDFAPFTLTDYAATLSKGGDPETALALLELNRQHNPDDAMIYVTIGNTYRFSDRPALAIENYRKALEINPNFGFVNSIIQSLESTAAESGD